MAMRNFWAEAWVDGRKGVVTFGPRGKDGGFTLEIFQRDNGRSRRVLIVDGRAVEDVLTLMIDAGGDVRTVVTRR